MNRHHWLISQSACLGSSALLSRLRILSDVSHCSSSDFNCWSSSQLLDVTPFPESSLSFKSRSAKAKGHQEILVLVKASRFRVLRSGGAIPTFTP
jgi:hypothetical protein